jgi:hypothetical protein
MDNTGMENIKAEIVEYAIVLNSVLENDDEILLQLVEEVVDRTLAYTNRNQLIKNWEEAVDLYGYEADPDTMTDEYIEEVFDYDGSFYNGAVPCPIPVNLRRALARVVVQMYKTVVSNVEASTPAVDTLSDNGQSVKYKDTVQSYLSTQTDTEVFGGLTEILNKFRMATV